MSIHSVEDAETVVSGLAADWAARNCFLWGAFDRTTDEFVAQIYAGPVDWALPEFEIGFIADRDREGQGFVTEAVQAMLPYLFVHLGAHRVGSTARTPTFGAGGLPSVAALSWKDTSARTSSMPTGRAVERCALGC